jgi:DNA-binding helix-hairpin-helix protein with protein kinase domain
MNQLFKSGASVRGSTSGSNYAVKDFIGGGGQGEVYGVNASSGDFALKWYHPETSTSEQAEKIDTLSRMAPPSTRFLWPLERATSPDSAGFGYVMDLRPREYKGLTDLLNGRMDPTFYALCTACIGLADSMHLLHSKGLCYQDINWGNVFFHPGTGNILICDNDNVCVNGSTATVLGTPRFMAPEIVRGEAQPSTDTDRFSLAVLLFMMLFRSHPLDGKKESLIHCLDQQAMKKLYGSDALFIFHPTDSSNAPVAGIHDNAIAYWPIYPAAVKKLFEKTFTDGIRDPKNGRVLESQWRQALSHMRDSVFRCSTCKRENFYDPATPGAVCWHCRKVLSPPLRIDINGLCQVAINYDTKLYPHHLSGLRSRYDFTVPLAEISQHPQNPSIWGLKNLSQAAWISRTTEGAENQVPPGRSAILKNGLKIVFGGGTNGVIIWE